MKIVTLIMVALLSTSCATPSHQTDKLVEASGSLPSKAEIKGVPLIEQEEYHCGPASLAMVMNYKGHPVDLNKLTKSTFTPLKHGTFQTDLISAIRREGLVSVPVSSIENLLREIVTGNPVIVFQNLGLKNFPKWHYAVATKYNLKGPDIYLHSGTHEIQKMDMRLFERTWMLAENFGVVILKPGELSQTATELEHLQGASGLEQVKNFDGAEKAYQGILRRWPSSLMANIGLGNVYFEKRDYKNSLLHLNAAKKIHPTSSLAYHNLAFAYQAMGNKKEARKAAQEALRLVDESNQNQYQTSLQNILD